MTASQVLSSGAFVALFPLGYAIGKIVGVRRLRDRYALALPLGIGAMSLPLIGSAFAGQFSPGWNGAWGWLSAIGSAAFIARSGAADLLAPRWKPMVSNGAIVIAVLGFAALIYALALVESPIGSRDEGIYTMAALALERAGTAEIAGSSAVARASGLFEPFINNIAFHLPGIPFADHLRPQFSPLLPAWIAQLHAVGGDAILYRFNVLAVVAGSAVVYALARHLLRPPFALLALLVFALNPASVWISRINLAEPLGALLALAGLLLVVASLRAGSRLIVVTAFALLALAAIVRVDAIIVSPLLIAASVVLASDDRRRREARALANLGLCALIAQAVAIGILGIWSPSYVREQLRMLALAPAVSALAFAAYAIVSRQPTTSEGQRRVLAAHSLCAVIATLAVYAALVRPHVEPFALIPDRGSLLAGMRDYRENSLRDLAAYIGWPTIIVALGGVMLTIQRAARGRGSSTAIALTVVAFGAAVVYLWAPGVSPDHPWAIRRMTTLVIPLTIVIAAHGLQSIVAATLHWRHRRFALIAAPIVVLSIIAVQWRTLRLSENAGLTAQIRALEASLPPGPLVVRGYDGLATTLALGFGREVFPLRDERIAVDAASRAFWTECRVRECTLLHQSYDGLNGLQIEAGPTLILSREYVEPTFVPLATRPVHETSEILTSRVSGIETRPPPSNAGAARDWRLDDSGFYRDELAPGAVARWSSGDATMTLARSPADRIDIRVASAAPGPMPVRIDIDGIRRFDGVIEPGPSQWRFPVDRASAAPHRLSLHSSTFVPAGTGTVGDRRSLGVSVRSVRLLAGDPPVLAAESPPEDFRSRVDVRPIVRASNATPAERAFRIDVDNRGASLWPAIAGTSQNLSTVALGSYWTRLGDSRRLIEQRIAMPVSLAPGERWSTAMTWDFDAEPLRTLPAGDYEVHVGMVLEGVAWFTDRGDPAVTIPVAVGAR